MNFKVTSLRAAGAALALAGGLAAATADEKIDVKVILDRNPFNLKAPEPPAPPAPPPEAPKTVKLSGIVSIIGPPRALLVRQEAGQTKPDYLTMREGEKDGAVEVVRIDPDAGEVEILNGGVRKVLTFKEDGLKPSGTQPAVAGVPGAVGGQPTASPVSPWTARAANTGASQGIPAGGATLAPGATSTGANVISTTELRTTPTRQVRVPISPQANSQPTTPPRIDPAAQQIVIEANRLNNPPDFPPLPPTDLSPLLQPK